MLLLPAEPVYRIEFHRKLNEAGRTDIVVNIVGATANGTVSKRRFADFMPPDELWLADGRKLDAVVHFGAISAPPRATPILCSQIISAAAAAARLVHHTRTRFIYPHRRRLTATARRISRRLVADRA